MDAVRKLFRVYVISSFCIFTEHNYNQRYLAENL